MLISWSEELVNDKHRIYNYGSCKLVIRFAKLTEGSSWHPTHTSLDNIPYAARYRPVTVSKYPNIVLIPNTDIFNYNEIQTKYEFQLETERKDEVIIHLYKELGIVGALREIQGEYSFILCDGPSSFLVRGITGTRGLSYLEYPNRSGPVLAGLRASLLVNHNDHHDGRIRHVPAGSIIYNDSNNTWRRKVFTSVYELPQYAGTGDIYTASPCTNGLSLLGQMRLRLRNIIRRVTVSRSKACTIGKVGLLLSAGLNSRVLGNVLREEQVKGLKTFFIGTKTSHERVASENGAKSIGSIHHDILLDVKQVFQYIPKVIELIETYDASLVRKGLLLYTICKYIHEKSGVEMLICGEGLDDIAGSHIYYKQARNAEEFQDEIDNNLKKAIGRDIYDKIASWFGITVVFPYLDPLFSAYYLSFTKEDRVPRFGIEKYFFRSCLDHSDLITEDVLWRHHEEWVDSASSFNKFWIKKVSKLSTGKIDKAQYEKKDTLYLHNTPQTTEEFYYREIYESLFPGQISQVPVIYRPGFNVGTDPSPRTWSIYPQHLCIDFLHTVRVMI